MFTEADGPTALRADLVRGLSLSLDMVELDTPEGGGRFCAALGAVWNGKKGYVALVLRQLDRPRLRRFVYAHPIRTPSSLSVAMEQGVAFLETMGFTMDEPDFTGLEQSKRKERLGTWNNIRKPKHPLQHLPGLASEAEDEEPRGAVLGRLALVRRDQANRPGAFSRLLSYF